MAIAAFLLIEAFWLTWNWEVEIEDGVLRARRWIDVWRSTPGVSVPLSRGATAHLKLDRGKQFEILSRDRQLHFWVGLWSSDDLRSLVSELQRRGIPVSADWSP
jgi:hypothetical protein